MWSKYIFTIPQLVVFFIKPKTYQLPSYKCLFHDISESQYNRSHFPSDFTALAYSSDGCAASPHALRGSLAPSDVTLLSYGRGGRAGGGTYLAFSSTGGGTVWRISLLLGDLKCKKCNLKQDSHVLKTFCMFEFIHVFSFIPDSLKFTL
jgi:hypothetical protein